MEATIQIKRDNALKAYRAADSDTKAVLENLFGKEIIPGKITDRIKTFNDVCAEAGENPDKYRVPENATKRERGAILFSMLELICDVFKEGVVLDYADRNQPKYYPWGKYNPGSGFSLFAVDCVGTGTDVGARLSVDTDEKARHIWAHFNYIYQDYWQDK